MKKGHLYLLCGCLTGIGLGLFLYKALVLGFPVGTSAKYPIWTIEAHITFKAAGGPASVAMFIPRSTRRYAIIDENFISRNYSLSTASKGLNRKVEWSILRAKGQQNLYYRTAIHRLAGNVIPTPQSKPSIEAPKFKAADLEATESLIAAIRDTTKNLNGFVAELLKRLNHPKPDDRVRLLTGKETTLRGKIDLAVRMLAQAKIPARSVHGIQLQTHSPNAPITHWLEVFDKSRWEFFNPQTGTAGRPEHFFVWWRGRGQLATLEGGQDLRVTLTVLPDQDRAVRTAIARHRQKHRLLVGLSPFALPLRAQAVYQVLLMVPIGTFLLVIFRNVVGIRTFGTFMPVLIALAFRETNLAWGVVLFSVLVSLGLCVRLYLEKLKLLVVPRLASVLIIVILLMLALSLLTHAIGFERGLSVALFPMVILTMTIERVSIIWDEHGPMEAIKQGVGSMIIAAIAYLVMSIPFLQHLLSVFPELLLVLLAGTLLLGRYTGYRLLELKRFKEIA